MHTRLHTGRSTGRDRKLRAAEEPSQHQEATLVGLAGRHVPPGWAECRHSWSAGGEPSPPTEVPVNSSAFITRRCTQFTVAKLGASLGARQQVNR